MPSSLSRTRPASQLASLSPHSSLCPASRPSKRAAHKRRSSEFRLLVNYDPYVPTKRFAPCMSSYRQGVACTSAPFPLPLPFAPHLLPLPRLELCTALEVAVKLPTATVLPLCASPGACSRPYFSRASRIASLQPAPNKPAVPAAACSASNSSLRATASSQPNPALQLDTCWAPTHIITTTTPALHTTLHTLRDRRTLTEPRLLADTRTRCNPANRDSAAALRRSVP